jgi:hypothetical protein
VLESSFPEKILGSSSTIVAATYQQKFSCMVIAETVFGRNRDDTSSSIAHYVYLFPA